MSFCDSGYTGYRIRDLGLYLRWQRTRGRSPVKRRGWREIHFLILAGVAPPLPRSLRQGGDFEFLAHFTKFQSPTLSRQKKRDKGGATSSSDLADQIKTFGSAPGDLRLH